MNIFLQLSIIVTVATILASIAKLFKQPLVISYVLAGLVTAPIIHLNASSTHAFEAFSEMGIAVLLFIVGLHLSPEEAADFGVSSLKVAVGQVVMTGLLGFVLSLVLGFSLVSSTYLAAALTFSSTIIVLKFLSDKRELEKLYGKVSVAVLLLQDIVAALALITASSFAEGKITVAAVLSPLLKGIFLTALVLLITTKLLPKLQSFFAESTELLFMFSLTWGFGLASLFNSLGLSMEIGALIAGVSLSLSPYAAEISGRLRPLRDFFAVMFFILIGSRIDISHISQFWMPLLVLLIFVVFIKPLVIISIMGASGYKKKTSFKAATALAQISEFSLILGLLGVKLGHISQNDLSLLTLLAVISISISAYITVHADAIYKAISKHLVFFEKLEPTVEEIDSLSDYEVILFGCNRVGYDFIEAFKDLGTGFLCVDYDPDLVKNLQDAGVNCKYGDAEDADFVDVLNLDKCKMVVSTVPDFEANMFLLKEVKKNKKVVMIGLSYNVDHALKLYEQGADYVIFPHFIGGRLVVEMIDENGFKVRDFKKEKSEHIEYLKERKELGHTHPGNLARFDV